MHSILPVDSFFAFALSFRLDCVVSFLCLFTAIIVWRHVHHPLYRFPGLSLAAWSNVLHSYWFLGGRQPYEILRLHENYGPVVRLPPMSSPSTPSDHGKTSTVFVRGITRLSRVPSKMAAPSPTRRIRLSASEIPSRMARCGNISPMPFLTVR